MPNLRAILVDDEAHCLETLRWQLDRYCPSVEVIGTHRSAREALTDIARQKPDVVFVDIEMPRMNAFEMLATLDPIDFHVIFTTAYDEYAVKAFKVNAVDYLLKPIDKDELVAAVQKAESAPVGGRPYDNLKRFFQQGGDSSGRISLSTFEGLEIIEVNDIIRCQSDSNYSEIMLDGGRKIIVSRTLKEVEEMLRDYPFFRVHHSHLVNLRHVRKYLRGDGGLVVMSDQSQVNVARSRKDRLINILLQSP